MLVIIEHMRAEGVIAMSHHKNMYFLHNLGITTMFCYYVRMSSLLL